MKPTSRGYVTLRTPSPYVKPRVLHNYLTTDEDRASILAGARVALQIAAQDALSDFITDTFVAPSADASDDELMEYIRQQTMTIYHPTSTAAIGQVVDPQLKVLGIDGLRVVDASVMPSIVRGNTNAPTIMIAERAADFIKQEAGVPV